MAFLWPRSPVWVCCRFQGPPPQAGMLLLFGIWSFLFPMTLVLDATPESLLGPVHLIPFLGYSHMV